MIDTTVYAFNLNIEEAKGGKAPDGPFFKLEAKMKNKTMVYYYII